MARASSLSILIRLCLTINYVSLCHIVLMLTDGARVSDRVGMDNGLFTCILLVTSIVYTNTVQFLSSCSLNDQVSLL